MEKGKTMPRIKADIEIGRRAFGELDRICDLAGRGNAKRAIQLIGCNHKTIYDWKAGVAPTAIYLARLHEMGTDVIWILTGRKGKTMDNYTATEEAYKNGKERMREAVIDKLKNMKGVALGAERRALDEAIRAVQKLEVI